MNAEKWLSIKKKIKRIVHWLARLALYAFILMSCFIGCMEIFEWKDYFGLGDEIFFVFSLFFSLFVAGYSIEGFTKFYHDTFKKDKKE